MLYYLKKDKNSTEKAKKKCCVAYKEGAVTDRTCQKWFGKFCARDFSQDNAPQSDRPVEIDRDQIKTLFENNQLLYYMGDSQHTENFQVKH